jgi:long-chain acyl-CoA synthetase
LQKMQTFKEIINNCTQLYPNKTAFIFEDKRYTYEQVNQRVNSLINALHSLGVKKGDHVGILTYNCSQYFEVFAVAKAGMVAVPLNFRSVSAELEYLINNSEISTLILEKDFIDVINSIRPKITKVRNFICLDAVTENMQSYEQLISRFTSAEPTETVQPTDMAAIFYSSGTTGRPKGAIHTHKSLIAEMLIPNRDLTSNDVALCVMPFFHVGGSAAYMLPAFASGATIVVLKKFDEEDVLRTIEEQKITYACFVPAMIIRLLDHPALGKYDVSSLRTIAYTGAPMPLEALKKAIKYFGQIFLQLLGQTETLNMTMLLKSDHKLNGSPKEMKRLESAGKPPFEGELRIVDQNGKEVKAGVPGEIVGRSDRMMTSYWKMPKETAETIRNGWLYTGDAGMMDADGYVYLIDRKKDMIISGGENIYSREVEDVIYTHPAVVDAAVIGVPDAKWGESVKAVLVLKEGMQVSEQEIIEFCKERLAGYKKPKSVEFWDTVPKTTTGKIKKNEIREKYWEGYERKIH